MSDKRDLPPAVIVHRPDCLDVHDRLLRQLPTAEIARLYPNGRRHDCFQFHQNSVGVVEEVHYLPHEYEESEETAPDAVRLLCRRCGGTHGVLDALVLPPGARTVDPPKRE
ncbi:hypothetical protein [Actinoplanes sp. NPDC026619]|uniref:hypothetical protein n=1 Tax=Actinoplanes sp. NPDC026619 TaxID=3155798 RepID=UPI0033EEEE63